MQQRLEQTRLQFPLLAPRVMLGRQTGARCESVLASCCVLFEINNCSEWYSPFNPETIAGAVRMKLRFVLSAHLSLAVGTHCGWHKSRHLNRKTSLELELE